MPARSVLWLVVIAIFVSGCATVARPIQSAGLLGEAPVRLPRKILVLPPVMHVQEISAGGVVERVDPWSKLAVANARHSLDNLLGKKKLFEAVPAPEFSAAMGNIVEQHAALYEVVAGNANRYARSNEAAWKHKNKDEFDYTLGPGLKVLKEQTGADAALFLIGEDYISSGGRKALALVALLMYGAIMISPSFLSAGVVDLETGDLLWFTYLVDQGATDLRNPVDADKAMEALFAGDPGAGKP